MSVPENNLRHVATFCGQCNCGCPELFIADDAPAERRVIITDDFGQKIEMSLDQLDVLVTDIKTGTLDGLLTKTGA
ncbi:hypothetical protein ACFQ05_03350 [Amycolatopsis umgeniensis]|uniref:Uncharacterized protein n=1 Tax=Amycolatopsis umgeniensis TaxID=336628 RepID=A0A841AZA0_9PSEU|nr:hypothetical protein [Amycolatopsis umgeniensis]MBB5852297.1 hypothetical protein [Amycolatopsis umgeniensis]